jgi:hypothetical protein
MKTVQRMLSALDDPRRTQNRIGMRRGGGDVYVVVVWVVWTQCRPSYLAPSAFVVPLGRVSMENGTAGIRHAFQKQPFCGGVRGATPEAQNTQCGKPFCNSFSTVRA